jgi:hypothetical protein
MTIALMLAAAVFVVSAVRRPEPPTFVPTETARFDSTGARIFTVNSSDSEKWRFFSFQRGALVEAPQPRAWDLGFRRFHIMTNGGPGFSGEAGIAPLGAVSLENATLPPDSAFLPTSVARDSVNPVVAKWYRYGFTTHMLTPKPESYAVRTADGRFAVFQILSYYCAGPTPGCLTIRYRYPVTAPSE